MPRTKLSPDDRKEREMEWHRRYDEDGQAYYIEKRGRYMIDKKVTDDRDYDGGYLTTAWTLHGYDPQWHFQPGAPSSGFKPIEMRETFADARRLAEAL